MTVIELIDKLTKDCPPNCNFELETCDVVTGETGKIDSVRLRTTKYGLKVQMMVIDDADVNHVAANPVINGAMV